MEKEKEGRLVANVMRTPDGTILQSYHVHDYVEHVDANGKTYMVDGGISYIRRTCHEEDNGEDLSVYSTDPHTKIREWFRWGSYGKEGKGPLVWLRLMDMETNHIQKVVDEGHARDFIKKIMDDELAFRKGKPLGVIARGEIRCYNSLHNVLVGYCVSHEYRDDLIGRWMTSSSIVNKLSDNTYETENTIYNVTLNEN